MLSTAWSHFITSHPLSTQISWTTDKHNITDILNPSQTQLSNDEEAIRLMHLSSYPSIIILTLDPFNHSILTSFQHDHLPNTTNPTPNTHTLVALTGFSSSATPIQINTSDFFSSTDTLYATPTLQDFLSMHDKTLNDLKLISAVETHTHPIRRTAVLPPFLNQIAFTHPSGSSPWTFLHSIIKCIWDQGQTNYHASLSLPKKTRLKTPTIPILMTTKPLHPHQLIGLLPTNSSPYSSHSGALPITLPFPTSPQDTPQHCPPLHPLGLNANKMNGTKNLESS
jgi:hypothetical protein